MNNKIIVVIGAIVVILIGVGIYMSAGVQENMVEDKMMTDESAMVNDEMMDTEDKMMMKGSYGAYSSEKVAWAETDDVVIFFHASWCPSCRGLNADIEKNIGAIPGGVHILKADYDTETELKKKYGVTYQHTMVQVDKDGNLIKKWSGSPSLVSLVAQIQ